MRQAKKKAFERNKDKIKLNFINGLQSKVDYVSEERKEYSKNIKGEEKKLLVAIYLDLST